MDGGKLSISIENANIPDTVAVAMDMRQTVFKHKQVEVVLTLPPKPCRLMDFINQDELAFVRVHDTKNVFIDISKKAEKRLVIMTPFLDEEGLGVIINLFQQVKSKDVEKVLIVRSKRKVKVLLEKLREKIETLYDDVDLNINVHEYLFRTEEKGKTAIETFHAKIIVADNVAAYIGSSNMTWASLSRSMEMGAYVHGQQARTVANIVDSILEMLG